MFFLLSSAVAFGHRRWFSDGKLKGKFGQKSKFPIQHVLGLKQCYESKTDICLRFYAVISTLSTSNSCFLTAAILPDKKTGASVAV